MFKSFKCPVCREWIDKHREDFCYATVSENRVVRVEEKPPAERPAEGAVYELHQRCREAFVSAPL